jgi:transcriptional regulator with XRE-family HTH domain
MSKKKEKIKKSQAVGSRLKKLSGLGGYSTIEISRLLDKSPTLISQTVSGTRALPHSRILCIADILGVDAEVFFKALIKDKSEHTKEDIESIKQMMYDLLNNK